MKHKSKNNAQNASQNIANYTRSKDAYDGNMEITNLKSCSQKLSGSTDSVSVSSTTKHED